MNTHITTMRYAMEIANLARQLDEKTRQIEKLQGDIAAKDEQLATLAACAKEMYDRNAASDAVGIPRLAA
ncbi:hypothetical protein [Chromobacterium haemolyticum]|uniref:hypothetical protein n=1 Tax=Chromobacterium TaxID=535 RepID=UPI00405709FA